MRRRRSLFQPVVGARLDEGLSATDTVWAYHQRTKHRVDAFAAGPDVLDWEAQPQPFRQWMGAPRALLPLAARAWPRTWAQAHGQAGPEGTMAPHPLNRAGVALWLEMALSLTAWKRLGPDRWALRANPSSGNLHPTEAYVLAQGVPGLPDGLFHYAPEDHALAWRAQGRVRQPEGATNGSVLCLGLSSIHWREAWKYGERAFRYCELDIGHAVGALRYAAAALGWRAQWDGEVPAERVAHLLGLDRADDFGDAEGEEPQGLMHVWVPPATPPTQGAEVEGAWTPQGWEEGVRWVGRASRLDPRPLYQWPVIEQVARASRPMDVQHVVLQRDGAPEMGSMPSVCSDSPMSHLVLGRRSAQRFDHRAVMSRAALERLLAPLQDAAQLPLDAWAPSPQVHLLVFAHRVEGLPAGAYALPRTAHDMVDWAQHLPGGLNPVSNWPGALPMLTVSENPALSGTLRTLSCHQALASDACVAFSLCAPMAAAMGEGPSAYRRLLQEAGLLGQALYLRAEAEGLRGTGIGCYFDDAVHEWLGWADARWQVLYHFTVGHPLTDPRLQSEPAYDEARQAADTPFNVSALMPGGDTGVNPP